MKTNILKRISIALFSGLLLGACADDDPVGPIGGDDTGYALLTMSENNLTKPGYISVFSERPSGNISNVNATSVQGMGMGGWRTYGNWAFKMFNTSGNEKGIERLSFGKDRQITVSGFIKTNNTINGSGNFVIQDESEGYYWDADNPLQIQTFNPTSMQRTGYIEVSEVAVEQEGVNFQAVGQHFLALKGGKLYADISYGKNTGAQSGMFDDYFQDLHVAVIDIVAAKYEKTITYPETGGIAYINDNEMYSFDDNGDLYIVTQGRSALGGKSKIVRIKASETDFDKNWEINMDDITEGGKFVTVYASNGKLITTVPTEKLTGGPTGNINFEEIWEFYTIDVNTRQANKIAGVPKSTNSGGAYATVKVDNKVLLRVNAPSQNVNGYFELSSDLSSASPLFNVTEGGSVSGLFKVTLE